MGWGKAGKGKSTSQSSAAGAPSFLQAALEGAVVSALGLAQFGKSSQSTSQHSGQQHQRKQWCRWKSCQAAADQKPTLGDKCECFKCGKHFASTPPVQQLVEWAYQELIESKKATKVEAGPKTKSKGKNSQKGSQKDPQKGKGKGAPASPPTASQDSSGLSEADAALRDRRLAELKEAGTGKAPEEQLTTLQESAAAKDLTVMEEVSAAWSVEGSENAAALRLDPQLAKTLGEWDLQPMFDTMKLDKLPVAGNPKTAEAIVAGILSESKPCVGAAAAVKLNMEIEALKKTLVQYEADGLEDLRAETESRLKATTDKLERSKTPTTELQRKDVVAVKAQFIKDAQARSETAGLGKSKAAERSAARAKILQDTIVMYQSLEAALTDRDAAIEAAHATRSAAIEARDQEVCFLFDQKTDQLAAKEAATKAATAAASSAAAASAFSSSAAVVANASASDLALQKAMLDLEASRKQQEVLLQKIQSMQTEAAQPSAPAALPGTVTPFSPMWAALGATASATPTGPSDGTVMPFTPLPTGGRAPATPMLEASHRYLELMASVDADTLPQPIPDKGMISVEIKDTIRHMEQFYKTNAFNAIPPTTPLELNTDIDTLFAMIGEPTWTAFWGDIIPTVDDALPTQMHAVLAHQVRRAAGMIKHEGDKGAGKGKVNPYY